MTLLTVSQYMAVYHIIIPLWDIAWPGSCQYTFLRVGAVLITHTPYSLPPAGIPCSHSNTFLSIFVCDVSSVSEWLRLLPLLGILALLGYLTIRPFLPKKKKQRDSLINLKIQKENPKVVNEIDIEDLNSANVCYCRCWRSKTVSAWLVF